MATAHRKAAKDEARAWRLKALVELMKLIAAILIEAMKSYVRCYPTHGGTSPP